MKILISTLLLALFGNKKESKCSTGEELTSSFIPAGLQVVNHYLAQIQMTGEDFDIGRRFGGASQQPGVPTVIVTYEFEESMDEKEPEIVEKLLKLSSAFDEEAAEQDLAECKGITSEVMRQLETSSRMSSRGQLSFILRRVIGGEVKSPKTKALLEEVLTELQDTDSALSKRLKSVMPLKYLSDLSLE